MKKELRNAPEACAPKKGNKIERKDEMNKRILLFIVAIFTASILISLVAGCGSSGTAQIEATNVQLPLVNCWYKGQVAYYIQTEASDPGVAAQQNVNYVPRLANAISAGAVDDIYAVTNFKQGNVIPSAPIPAGPNNADPNYSPLWQVSTVTWNQGTTPNTLKSEEDVLAAQAAGTVTIVKTNIVVNCPVMFTPQGGLLPTAKLL